MKSVVADTSSIILLQKTCLLKSFLSNYSVVIAKSVFFELTHAEKKGVTELAHLLGGKLKQPLQQESISANMGLGERDTIELYSEGNGDFILVDDKSAAKWCRACSFPFINSLLVPRVLYAAGLLSVDECQKKFSELVEVGYYSAKVVRMAKGLDSQRIKFFSP